MPQMAPINWLILFIIFSTTLIIFNIKNYYCNFYKSNKSSQSIFTPKINNLIWK
uniref:ATP synthase complex subunit 8 n=1 Tax=Coquillettidia chrysonotum TaxID=2597061 RepID=A0A5B9HEB4_9DIPT|nr:ATP synthase F0 subunit 8 [Coquillettidia chrysonotum]QEE94284.1 ATP synthase F0 subunit 8 [Coquillettidia chrysonotum]